MNECEKTYWSAFYTARSHANRPSPFAQWVVAKVPSIPSLSRPLKVLDCGSGNGRDTYFLADSLGQALGVDASFRPQETEKATFQEGNFVTWNKDGFDVIYSRFSYHSITDEMQQRFWNSLPSGSWLFLETRSSIDRDCEREHGDGHYRNFTDASKILSDANKFATKVFLQIGRGMAKYRGEDPMVLRLICRVR